MSSKKEKKKKKSFSCTFFIFPSLFIAIDLMFVLIQKHQPHRRKQHSLLLLLNNNNKKKTKYAYTKVNAFNDTELLFIYYIWSIKFELLDHLCNILANAIYALLNRQLETDNKKERSKERKGKRNHLFNRIRTLQTIYSHFAYYFN